ncbi:MAG: hypothetical protein AAFP19_18785 [Bacteroidota bacterium]
MKKTLFFAFCCLLFMPIAEAQLEKVLHQTFEVEGISNISLDIAGELEIVKWAGNTILAETNVQLYDASPSVMRFVLDKGRYDILANDKADDFKIFSKNGERATINTKQGQVYEMIKVRIFVPEDFEIVDNTSLQRPSPDQPVTSKND